MKNKEIYIQKNRGIAGHLLQRATVRAPKPFGTRSEAVASILQSPSEQPPARIPSKQV